MSKLLAVVALSLALTGCGGTAEPTGPDEETEAYKAGYDWGTEHLPIMFGDPKSTSYEHCEDWEAAYAMLVVLSNRDNTPMPMKPFSGRHPTPKERTDFAGGCEAAVSDS